LNDDAAFSTLEDAFTNDPDSDVAGSSLATAYLAVEKYEEAKTLGNNLVSQGKILEGRMLLGIAYGRSLELEESLKQFELAYIEAPDNNNVKGAVIESMVRFGSKKEAQSKLTEWAVAEENITLLKTYVSATNQSQSLEELVEAVEFIESIIAKSYVGNKNAKLLVAQSYFVAKEHQKAADALLDVESDFSDIPEYWLISASNLIQLQDLDGALESYTRWMDIEPENPMPLTGAIRIHTQKREFKFAIALIDAKIGNYEQQGPGNLIKLQLLISDSQFELAKKTHARLPDDMKKSVLGTGLKGILDLMEGDYASTIEKLAPLYEQVKSSENLRWMVGAYTGVGDLDKSIEIISDYILTNPKSQVAQYLLGNAYASKDMYVQAAESYEKAIIDGTQNPFLLNNAAFVNLKLENFENALELAQQAVLAIPQNPSFVDTLASIYIKIGEFEKAKTLMKPFIDEGISVNNDFKETYEKAVAGK
jgi:tetratricopeptide (TPR) repeat protein